VQGTGPAGAQLTVGTTGHFATATVAADGTWSAQLPGELTPGQHTINALGVSMIGQASRDITIDTLAPKVQIQAPFNTGKATPTVFVNVSPSDGLGVDPTVQVDVDLNNDGQFQDDELGVATGTLDSSGVASVTLPDLAPGSYEVRARGNDAAG